MNIAEIKRRFDLLKTANASNYCLVSELAKMSKENQVYHDSAMRRLNASDVWIEDNTIKYRK